MRDYIGDDMAGEGQIPDQNHPTPQVWQMTSLNVK